MADPWAWAAPARERHFGGVVMGEYRLEPVDEDTYWDVHEAELREHFPPEAFFDGRALAGPERSAARERLEASEGATPLADHWLVRAADGSLAGEVCTTQRSGDTFELYHVNLHPAHRGRGLYADLLRRVLAYADELGFAATVSIHAPCNNPVLIAHLRAGFMIESMLVDARHGPSVQLIHFHDPALRRAFEYRCGLAVMDEALRAAGRGHFALLDDQFAAARAAAAGGRTGDGGAGPAK